MQGSARYLLASEPRLAITIQPLVECLFVARNKRPQRDTQQEACQPPKPGRNRFLPSTAFALVSHDRRVHTVYRGTRQSSTAALAYRVVAVRHRHTPWDRTSPMLRALHRRPAHSRSIRAVSAEAEPCVYTRECWQWASDFNSSLACSADWRVGRLDCGQLLRGLSRRVVLDDGRCASRPAGRWRSGSRPASIQGVGARAPDDSLPPWKASYR